MLDKINEFEELISKKEKQITQKDKKISQDEFDIRYPEYCFVKHISKETSYSKEKTQAIFGPYWIVRKTKGRIFLERIKFSDLELPLHTNKIDVFELIDVKKKYRLGEIGDETLNYPMMEKI